MEIKPRVQGSDKEQVGMGVSGVSLFFFFSFLMLLIWNWTPVWLAVHFPFQSKMPLQWSDWLSVFHFRPKWLCRHRCWPSAAPLSAPKSPRLLADFVWLRAWEHHLLGGKMDLLVIFVTDGWSIACSNRRSKQSDLHIGGWARLSGLSCGRWAGTSCGRECELHFCGHAAAGASELCGRLAPHVHHARAEDASLRVSVIDAHVVMEGGAGCGSGRDTRPRAWESSTCPGCGNLHPAPGMGIVTPDMELSPQAEDSHPSLGIITLGTGSSPHAKKHHSRHRDHHPRSGVIILGMGTVAPGMGIVTPGMGIIALGMGIVTPGPCYVTGMFSQ